MCCTSDNDDDEQEPVESIRLRFEEVKLSLFPPVWDHRWPETSCGFWQLECVGFVTTPVRFVIVVKRRLTTPVGFVRIVICIVI